MPFGLRGVGETVLLKKICELAEANGYAVVMIERTESRSLPGLLIPALRRVLIKLDALEGLSAKVKRGMRVLRSFVGAVKLKVGEIGLDIDPEKGLAD